LYELKYKQSSFRNMACSRHLYSWLQSETKFMHDIFSSYFYNSKLSACKTIFQHTISNALIFFRFCLSKRQQMITHVTFDNRIFLGKVKKYMESEFSYTIGDSKLWINFITRLHYTIIKYQVKGRLPVTGFPGCAGWHSSWGKPCACCEQPSWRQCERG